MVEFPSGFGTRQADDYARESQVGAKGNTRPLRIGPGNNATPAKAPPPPKEARPQGSLSPAQKKEAKEAEDKADAALSAFDAVKSEAQKGDIKAVLNLTSAKKDAQVAAQHNLELQTKYYPAGHANVTRAEEMLEQADETPTGHASAAEHKLLRLINENGDPKALEQAANENLTLWGRA
jgi:hypothetical protein